MRLRIFCLALLCFASAARAGFTDADWLPVGSGMNGLGVYALAVSSNGTLYAGGNFTNAGGIAANYIAQWNGTNWSPLGSGMSGGNFWVEALAVSGGTLYAAGLFTNAGGSAANYIAQWNGTNWSVLGSGMSYYVEALAVSSNGTLYAGGWFTTAGGNSAINIAQWNGTTWSPLGSGLGRGPFLTQDAVLALAVSGGTLYAGGLFTNAGAVAASHIAQWNGTTWSTLGSGMSNSVNALAVSGGTLYAGGLFTNAGGIAANYIAQWNGTNWSPLGSGMNGEVVALAVSGTTLYAGGNFTNAGGVAANYVAQWNGTNWSALGSGMGNDVAALAMSGTTLYVGGDFTRAGTNASAYYIAEGLLAEQPASLSIITTNPAFGFTNGLFGFDISGPPGSNVVIQSSPDLQNWTSLQTNQFNTNGLLYFSDPQPPSATRRFYQAILP